MVVKTSNNNHPQPKKITIAPSASKHQHQCSRQSHKCHVLCMNAFDHLFQWQQQQQQQQYQIINDHAQWQQKYQTTIILNQKNSLLHLLQEDDNISAQDSTANVMLFEFMPLITSSDGNDDNNFLKQLMVMLHCSKNIKQQSPSTHCTFHKRTTTSMLKTKPQMPCFCMIALDHLYQCQGCQC